MINDKIKTAGLLALFALLPACADDAPFDKGHEPESRTHEYYLRLTLRHPEAGLPTRSTPTGGEPGDGHEPGQDHETRIDDLTLLFYRGTDGVNSDASTPIDKILYLDRDAMEGDNRTEPVPVNLPAGEYDLLTVANSGDLRPQLQGKTLGGVRRHKCDVQLRILDAFQLRAAAYILEHTRSGQTVSVKVKSPQQQKL